MSIWTLTSPQPLTSSLKSSAVKSSRAFLGRTSSKPFLIAYPKKKKKKKHNREYIFDCLTMRSRSQQVFNDFTYMKRLLSHHKHSVLSILPYILIHVKRCHWHVDPTREKLHLSQKEYKCWPYSGHIIYVCYNLQCWCGSLPVPPLPLYRGQWQRLSPWQQILHLLHRPESGG